MLVLTNGTLIDGTGHSPIQKATIITEGNLIKEVNLDNKYPSNSRIVDLHGFTIMPGLIDCHLHLGGLTVDEPGRAIGTVSFKNMVSFFFDYSRNYAHRRHLAIKNGVTTIRSAGDHYPHIIRLRDKIASGKISGPRIFAPGPTITAPEGHPAGTIYKGNRYIIENATRQIADVNSAREEVRRLAEGRVDCIKAIYSDINPMDITNKVPRLSLEVLHTLADEAHNHHLKLMVHTGTPAETLDAVKAGADSIEHGILPGSDSVEFNDDLIKLMLDKGTYFVPTLAIAWAYKDAYPDIFSGLKQTCKKLHTAGIKIAAGTDSGTPGVVIGKGLHKELELMVEAGISPMEAIMAGTIRAADNLGKVSELGTLEEGKLADMIVVAGNPLDKIEATRDIKMVIKNGLVFVNKLTD
jgi:enamidase